MTFNPIAALNAAETLHFINCNKKNVIDIGSQTPTFGPNTIDVIVERNSNLDKNLISNLLFIKDKLLKKEKIMSEDFFKALKFSQYSSIDLNGAYNSLNFDLNHDIKEKYKFNKKFSLVINNGTGEHVFNQYSLFKNIHDLCSVGGVMLHILPFIDWINHGFYSFHPIMFADLTAANNYNIKKLSFANRDGGEILINKEFHNDAYEHLKPKNQQSLLYKILDHAKKCLGKNIILVCAMQKTNSEEFKIPLQGKYLSDLDNNKSENHYINQAVGSGNAKNQLPDNLKRVTA